MSNSMPNKHVVTAAKLERFIQTEHGNRVAARQHINGQPNGYRPMTEAELQASKQSDDMAIMKQLVGLN